MQHPSNNISIETPWEVLYGSFTFLQQEQPFGIQILINQFYIFSGAILSIIQSRMMSVRLSVRPTFCLSVCLKLRILVTTEPIGLYSLGNISNGPGMVLSYFLGGWDTPNPQKNEKSPPQFFLKFFFLNLNNTKIG